MIGFALIVVFVSLLLFLGNDIVQKATQQQVEMRETTVRPLAEVGDLQASLYRLRMTEVNLRQLTDYFAVSATVAQLEGQVVSFTQEWQQFSERLPPQHALYVRKVSENWSRLAENLLQIARAESRNDKREAELISLYQSQPRFESLSKDLNRLSSLIRKGADDAFEKSVQGLERQQHNFMLISAAGLLLGALLLLMFARYLGQRIRYLQRAFSRIAEGEAYEQVDLVGGAELAELAASFNLMQQKVSTRQAALNRAREQLEQRVAERTAELNRSNQHLMDEVNERKRAEQDLKVFSRAVSQSPVGIYITGADGDIQYANAAVEEATGFLTAELNGRGIDQLIMLESTQSEALEGFTRALQDACEWRGEVCSLRKGGAHYWAHAYVSPVSDGQGEVSHFLVMMEDISERREQAQQLFYQARFDPLTDLPNRALGMERLAQGVRSARRNQDHLVVMFIDLDGFKNVNDTLGHDIGDQLLVMAAARLEKSVRDSDVVARLGGDEFLIILHGVGSQIDAQPVLDKIKQAFSEPFELSGHSLQITPSIGLAAYPEDGEDGPILLRNADLAMYQAKEAGRNTYRFFNQEIHENLRKRMELEHQLKYALERGELYLLYQPIVETRSGRLLGVETLLRWNSQILGQVMPDQFIGIAEQTGQIIPIGNWVIEHACAQVARWQQSGLTDLNLAINVSPRQIQEEGLPDVINRALQLSELPPHCLTLEMTEGLLIRNPKEARDILGQFKQRGIALAMDDFGTGYSSLSNLKNYPFDVLKIDRTFVRDIEADPEDRSLVAAAISMSKGLDLRVVAEGVETPEQLRILEQMNCDRVQGYLFSEPLTAEAFRAWAESYPGGE
ncbi:EAL domain-containing protein [Neptuniibacter halophilus]|uniref:EAL domain-containing protein n=1 Tax=Neptuniibacter halophilus TaxID=651666 RepID=UPI0025723407|nr:EAL domain-containing protein [Neptuniibacter halophilus]